ncbi:MAG: endonuclease/exonuclease/phosphatase family protein [Actinomycetota bacterium]|nr:endonuclease/exonuclease/phosphatase family protein [Actinomycetota bacterium]
MRIVTYNVRRCELGLDTVAAALRSLEPEVVGLNEIEPRQARRLGRALRMHAVAGPVTRLARFGNAILLREKPQWARRLPFSRTPDRERRAIVVAGTGSLAVGVTHLGLDAAERARHAEEASRLLRGLSPAVLCADVNEERGEALNTFTSYLRDTFAVAGTGDAFTYPAAEPRIRIDYIFATHDVAVTRCRVAPIPDASDHRPVVADVTLLGRPAR